MKRLLMLILILIGLVCDSQILYADEPGGTTSFWENLRNKLESFTPREKTTSTTTATAGVRGAPMASDDMYWKGEASSQTIDSDELEEFKKAIALVDSGDKKQAQNAFSEFIKKYPDSPLRKDADQALELSTP